MHGGAIAGMKVHGRYPTVLFQISFQRKAAIFVTFAGRDIYFAPGLEDEVGLTK